MIITHWVDSIRVGHVLDGNIVHDVHEEAEDDHDHDESEQEGVQKLPSFTECLFCSRWRFNART